MSDKAPRTPPINEDSKELELQDMEAEEITSDSDDPPRQPYCDQPRFPNNPDEESMEDGHVPSSGEEEPEPPKPRGTSEGAQPKELPRPTATKRP